MSSLIEIDQIGWYQMMSSNKSQRINEQDRAEFISFQIITDGDQLLPETSLSQDQKLFLITSKAMGAPIMQIKAGVSMK